MKTIVVTNRKGGVGKTTISTHLAAGLALHGRRVAIVDTDPQGHVALAFGMPKENGLYTIMTDEDAQFSDVMRVAPPERLMPPGWTVQPNLYVLPGSKGTTMIPIEQPSPFRFKSVLNDMADLLDLEFVIVDTGPSQSMFDGSVNFAADYFLYVTECASLSFDGLGESMDEMNKINREQRHYRQDPVQIMGIIPNKGQFKTRNHRENIALLSQEFESDPEVVWNPITKRTAWEVAMDYGQMVFSYMPEGQEAKDAWDIVGRVEKKVAAYA